MITKTEAPSSWSGPVLNGPDLVVPTARVEKFHSGPRGKPGDSFRVSLPVAHVLVVSVALAGIVEKVTPHDD